MMMMYDDDLRHVCEMARAMQMMMMMMMMMNDDV